MGRHRAFDEAAVIDAAVACFWQDGYGATSVRGLSERMRIGGASLYNAFGDKRTLFARALQHYLDRSSRRRIARLDGAADPLGGLHEFFEGLIAASVADRRGCLLVNSAVEIAPFDEELGALVRAGLREVEDAFQRAIARAQQQGQVPDGAARVDLARGLLSAAVSIRVLARSGMERPVLESIARAALPPRLGDEALPS